MGTLHCSEKSIELGNATVDFPDFTSGKWMTRTNKFALDDSYLMEAIYFILKKHVVLSE